MSRSLQSFDGTENFCGWLVRPEHYRDLEGVMQSGRCIPRGSGLSYCAASAGDEVQSISTQRFNRILSFNRECGRLVVEPGVSVGELFEFAVSRGWHLPVLPGHPKITVGGCIGFNVHGKSHHHHGNFINCVESVKVYHPDHEYTSCSPQQHPELFETTIGGFGLTGFITEASLRLIRLPGGSVERSCLSVDNLIHAVEVMEDQCQSCAYLYSWNDLSATGDKFGRGIVYREDFAAEELPMRGRFRELDPDRRGRFRPALLNRLTIPIMNRTYLMRDSRSKPRRLDLKTAAFPLNGKEIYYDLFGRSGFREYQMLVPREQWDTVVDTLAFWLRRLSVRPSLGSLKLFRGSQKLLHFDGTGVCLTIDVPSSEAALKLFDELDDLTRKVKGIVNLSKDSRLQKRVVQNLFPQYDLFRKRIEEFDPKRRLDSALRRRLLT